jgi:hypothetical protein
LTDAQHPNDVSFGQRLGGCVEIRAHLSDSKHTGATAFEIGRHDLVTYARHLARECVARS